MHRVRTDVGGFVGVDQAQTGVEISLQQLRETLLDTGCLPRNVGEDSPSVAPADCVDAPTAKTALPVINDHGGPNGV